MHLLKKRLTKLSWPNPYKIFTINLNIKLLYFIFFLGIPVAPFTALAQDSKNMHAHPEWIANRESVTPGEKFYLGLYFKLDPDWHIYWRNGGEVGLPVRILELKVRGVTLGNIEWPTPIVHRDSIGLISNIYLKETLLRIPAKVSKSVKAGDRIFISAKIKWLECKDSCIPWQVRKKIEIKVTDNREVQKGISQRKFQEIFKRFAERYPKTYTKKVHKSPIKIQKFGWEYRPKFNHNLKKWPKTLFTVEALLPLSKQTKEMPISKAWRFCRIIGFEKGDKEDPDWEFGRGRIDSKGEQSQGRVVVFSIPVEIPPQYTNKPWVELICPHLKASGLDIPIPLANYKIVKAVQDDKSSYAHESFIAEKKEAAEISSILSINFFWMILAAFLGGLILNVMPCVLPVISIKIFSLTSQAGKESKKVFRLGILFVLGIIFSFLCLALLVIIVRSMGKAVGWGFQFQNPLFLIALAVILLIFALSLFNVFTFNVPRINVLGKKSLQSGDMGSFFQGVLATILATPCSAPFLGSAMGFAFSQNFAVIIIIFFFAGLGMASPYIVLAWKPATLKYLPKPGTWMESFKQFLGFLLMATLVWIVWILGRMTGADGIINLIILLLVVSLGLWFGGIFAPLGSSRSRFWVSWICSGLIIIFGNVIMIPSILSSKPDGSGIDAVFTVGDIRWQKFSPRSLRKARKSGRPIFLKFTADWCLTCKVNERTVLVSDSVVESFKKWNVIPISADWTTGDIHVSKLLNRFGRAGVPFYVVYPPGENSKPIPLSEIITPSMIAEALEKTRTNYEQYN